MASHDLVSLYSVKAVEYLIAIAYLVLFVPFWRFVQGGVSAAQPHARKVSWKPAEPGSWFELPDDVGLHPGHAWARAANGAVAVGLDDFAHRLIGPPSGFRLPAPGDAVRQGQPALQLVVGDKAVDVLAPVAGTVTEVNPDALADPVGLQEDPYGRGWLFRVKPDDMSADRRQLLSGGAARAYVDQKMHELTARMSPELGALAADGGVPVRGFARELDPAGWDAMARRAFLTFDVPVERS